MMCLRQFHQNYLNLDYSNIEIAMGSDSDVLQIIVYWIGKREIHESQNYQQ